jgi:hypothetical protein
MSGIPRVYCFVSDLNHCTTREGHRVTPVVPCLRATRKTNAKSILGPDGSPVRFVEANTSYFSEDSDHLIIKHEQDIPGWFLDDLADERQASTNSARVNFTTSPRSLK